MNDGVEIRMEPSSPEFTVMVPSSTTMLPVAWKPSCSASIVKIPPAI